MALPKLEAVITADTKQAEAGFDRVQAGLRDVERSADRAGMRTQQLGVQMGRSARSSGAMKAAIQNASFQLGDFAVMVGGGVDASRALATQLPQLLGPFGVLGAVMSAVVAVGIPLAAVFSGNAEAAGTLRDALGTVAPMVDMLGNAMQAAGQIAIQFAELVVNNLDRIIITAGVAATFFAGKFVAGFVAARIATMTLSGALLALRGALIRTGIGAIIVGAGELVYQFTRLMQAAGGFGEAMGLLADVATEVWGRVEKGGRVVELGVISVAHSIQSAWLNALALMQEGWAKFVSAVASVALKIPGMEGLGSDLAMGAAMGGQAVDQMRAEADRQSEYASAFGSQAAQLLGTLSEPLEGVQKIRDLLASIKDEKITLPDLLGAGADATGAGGGKSPLEQQLDNYASALERVREAGRSTWGALGDFMQQFAGKSKAAAIAAIAIQKGLSIAQIIANTAAAQMRALAELGPIAGPPVAAKIGMYGKLQAGLVAATGLAQAMGGGGSASGGGGGGSSGGGGAAGGGSSAPGVSSNVAIQLTGGDMFSRDQVIQLINSINDAVDDGARIRLV